MGEAYAEHTEDCPADRGDCTCGGYVPLSVADSLRTENERYRAAIKTALDTMATSNDMQLGPGGGRAPGVRPPVVRVLLHSRWDRAASRHW